MQNYNYTAFGKTVKKRLVDLGLSQNWLIERVHEETGLYFDRSYLYKIQTGRIATPSIINAICRILDLSVENQTEAQTVSRSISRTNL